MESFDSLLLLDHVRCRCPDAVRNKLQTFVNDGAEKLLVISDFDYTLSKAHNGAGKRCWTTYTVFENVKGNGSFNLSEKCNELLKYYHPIEFSPDLSIAEKIPHMEKWWADAHELIINARIPKSELQAVLRKGSLILRDGCIDFIRHLESRSIPLVVFSAGIGFVVQDALDEYCQGNMPKNVHIISNRVEFDEEGILCAFREPIIHTFNKNSSTAEHMEPEFFARVNGRGNTLLLGDTIGDANMHVHHSERDSERELKIGFLNRDVRYGNDAIDKLLPQYLDAYDIVLVDDPTMKVPSTIVDLISRKRE